MAKNDFLFPVDEWGDLLLASAPLLKVLQGQAKQGGCTFPVEWLIFDVDDNLLVEYELQGPEGRVTSYKGDLNAPLPPIRWPVTIKATDAEGRAWEQTISGPTVQ
jgi:hypothetical protein